METTRLSLLSLPFLLLAIAAAATTGGELSTFIVHVQAEENHVFGDADDRKAWYHSFLPDHGRLVHAYHHVASGFAARLTRPELEALSTMPGFLSATRARTYTTLTTHARVPGAERRAGAAELRRSSAAVIVGVIDTGIFRTTFLQRGRHAAAGQVEGRCDFSGTSCNNKLIGARNFVAAFNGPNGTSRGCRRSMSLGTGPTPQAPPLERSCRAPTCSATHGAPPLGWRSARISPCTRCATEKLS
ncbi:hypothetical protein ZWY2020_054908 [Hordeum vulgare]|nr:hypothetical protein ZWY2020_054908 [Hordeum vulgare]